MTRISNLTVKGFKGIEHLEVEPGSINIITGRNNTGKTSLLESIDLAFNPEAIDKFSGDLDKVIHTDEKSCLIDAIFSKEQKTLLADYSSDDPEFEHREVALRSPEEDEAIDIFNHVLQRVIEMNEEYPMRFASGMATDAQSREELQNQMFEALNDSVSELSPDVYHTEATNNIIIIEVRGSEYAYVHLGDYYQEVRQEIIEESISGFRNKLSSDDSLIDPPDEHEEDIYRRLEHGFRDLLVPRFGSDRFVGGSPPSIEGVKMVDSPLLSSNSVDMSKENAAIKLSNIEEYLQDNEIMRDLNDFSFDRVVFDKNEGEKFEVPYSFMGDGLKTVVGILWEVMDVESAGDVLLLEEPTIHMHPGYIENIVNNLVSIARENSLQLFITTHDLDLIEAFFSDSIREEEAEFLTEALKIIQLTEPVPRTLDYKTAEEEIEELGIDLRGI